MDLQPRRDTASNRAVGAHSGWDRLQGRPLTLCAVFSVVPVAWTNWATIDRCSGVNGAILTATGRPPLCLWPSWLASWLASGELLSWDEQGARRRPSHRPRCAFSLVGVAV